MKMAAFLLDNLGPYCLGAFLIIYSFVTAGKRYRFKAVSAVCLGVHADTFFTADTVSEGRSGTYQYQFDGVTYTETDKSFLNPRRLKTGKSYTLYVDPKNPERFITEFRVGYAKLFFVLGICFLVAPTFLF